MDNLQQQVDNLTKEVETLKKLIFKDNYSDLQVFTKKVQFKSGVNLDGNTTLGTSIEVTPDKIGFFEAIPVVQQTTFTAPAGGATVDAEARTAIGAIKTIFTNLGLTT